jgi:hypothetical protein
VTAVRGRDRVHDGQPEPGAAGRGGTGCVAADEPLEQPGLEIGGDTRPVVGDTEHHCAHGRIRLGEGYRHRGAGRGVTARIAEQVGEHLPEAVLVPADQHRLIRQFQLPAMIGGRRPGVAGSVDGQPGQVDRFAGQRAARVQLGQQQQFVHQHAHPGRLRLHPAESMGDVGRHRPGMPAGKLGIAPDRRQRCAQLVAGVGGEPAQPGLARRPPGQRGLDVAEHAVERRPHLADLGPGVGVRHPLRQPDLPTGQRQLGDPGRSGGDPAQRPQRQPHERGADDPGEHQHRAEHRDQREFDPPQGGFHFGQRQAGDEHVPVPPGHRDQPVVRAEPGQFHRVEVVSPGQPGERGLVRGGRLGLAAHQPLRGHHTIFDPGAERARRQPGNPAAVLLAGHRTAGGRRCAAAARAPFPGLLDGVVGLHAAGIPAARRRQLGVDLVQQGLLQGQVGDDPDHRASHRQQRDQPGDEAAAQGAAGQPAAQPGGPGAGVTGGRRGHQLAGLST